MRIIFLSNMKNYSGGELVMERLVLQLKHLHSCTIVTPEGLFAARCRENKIDVYIEDGITKMQRDDKRVGYFSFAFNTFRAVRSIAKYVRKESVDLIVANSFGVSFYAVLLKAITGRKTVWIHHHPIFTPVDRDRKKAKLIAGFTDKIICVSNALKRSLILCNVPASKIEVIYNGLDLNIFKPNFSPDLNRSAGLRISLIGAITEWKGHKYLLEAAHLLDEEVKQQISIKIVGGFLTESDKDIKYKQELDQMIEKYNLQECVSFTGAVKNMVEYYQSQTDVVVNCSVAPEPLGTTIYEAMAFEKLVIVTNVGGNTEIVDNNENGFVVDVEKPLEMAKVIASTVNNWNSSSLQLIRRNARQKVEREFDLVKTAEKYNFQFKQLVAR